MFACRFYYSSDTGIISLPAFTHYLYKSIRHKTKLTGKPAPVSGRTRAAHFNIRVNTMN